MVCLFSGFDGCVICADLVDFVFGFDVLGWYTPVIFAVLGSLVVYFVGVFEFWVELWFWP